MDLNNSKYLFSAIIVLAITLASAMLLYGNYLFFGQPISALGVGSTALIFNTGFFISALLFCLYFLKSFLNEKDVICKIGFLIGAISMIFMGGIAAFPLNMLFEHIVVAFSFFLLVAITILVFSIHLFRKNKLFSLFGFVIIALILFYFSNNSALIQKLVVFFFVIWILIINRIK
jgi:hypothetical membrane protein